VSGRENVAHGARRCEKIKTARAKSQSREETQSGSRFFPLRHLSTSRLCVKPACPSRINSHVPSRGSASPPSPPSRLLLRPERGVPRTRDSAPDGAAKRPPARGRLRKRTSDPGHYDFEIAPADGQNRQEMGNRGGRSVWSRSGEFMPQPTDQVAVSRSHRDRFRRRAT